jgi:hypothetical protein
MEMTERMEQLVLRAPKVLKVHKVHKENKVLPAQME